jgi:hypothetical protein
MQADRRGGVQPDRRARRRGGRRAFDARKPWYMRRRLWLAAASLGYVAWHRVRTLARVQDRASRAA